MQEKTHTRRSFLTNTFKAGIAAVALPHPESNPFQNRVMHKRIDPRVFLFQGDSITDGNRGRTSDPNHIMGHGYAFSIASRAGAAFPEKRLSFFNRGVSGNTLSDLRRRWQEDTIDIKPDVLSILIGVNDTESAVKQKDAAATHNYEDGYRTLLNQTKTQLPDCALVLCEPFIAPVGRVKAAWNNWQSEIQKKQEVVRQLAKEYNAVLVPLQKVFDDAAFRASADYWIWDGIHPTVAGHELIARQWLREVSKQLHYLKKLV